MSKTKSIIVITLITIIVAIVGVMCFASFDLPGNSIKRYNSILSTIDKGIDLKGGYYAVLDPSTVDGKDVVLDDAITVLQTRLDNNGYTEATISVQDGSKIRVEIPDVDNVEEVFKLITNTGELQFRDSTGYVWIKGSVHLKSAELGMDNDGKYCVNINFNSKGAARFYEATSAILKLDTKTMPIYLGDELISSPTVNEAINKSSASITGSFTREEAETLANVINSGKSTYVFKVESSRRISATLGEDALSKAILAAGIGLVIIFVLMLIVYKGLGLVADFALIIYTIFYVVLLAIIPGVQLTLPGIAGIILSIGMAVDANVLIFERIKDEYAVGKTVTAAIKSGFKRAVVTVLDSNITTVIAAICLFLFSNGSIKGFSVTLLLGIVVSMFTAVLVSRGLIALFRPLSKHQDKFFNLVREEGNENA